MTMHIESEGSILLVSKNRDFLHNYSAINTHHEENDPSKESFMDFIRNTSVCIKELSLLPVVLLMTATATERITYKVTVDRMLPYQFILVEIIFFLSFVIFSCMTIYKLRFTREITDQMRQFPHSKIMIMAVIDTVQFIMLTFSASEVSPTMSVLLLHASTMFILIGAKFIFPSRKYSQSHKNGVLLISLAICICLVKIALNNVLGDSDPITTVCSVVYVGAAAVQGLSTLYKEKAITAWSQPIDIHYLSSWLFFYQLVATFALSILYYIVRGLLGYSLQADPLSNVQSGLQCFLGYNPEPGNRETAANCSNSMWLICSYVLSNFLVLECTTRVLQLSNRILGRAMAAAILVAFLALWAYDIVVNRHRGSFVLSSANVGLCDVLAMGILLWGMEVYGRDPEPDEELITNYAQNTTTTTIAPPMTRSGGISSRQQAFVDPSSPTAMPRARPDPPVTSTDSSSSGKGAFFDLIAGVAAAIVGVGRITAAASSGGAAAGDDRLSGRTTGSSSRNSSSGGMFADLDGSGNTGEGPSLRSEDIRIQTAPSSSSSSGGEPDLRV